MWGIDLGTTNTTIGRWDPQTHRPQLVALPGLERHAEASEGGVPPPRLIPSATQLIESPSTWARLTAAGPFAGWLLSGRLAHIGQRALDRSDPARPRGFAP